MDATFLLSGAVALETDVSGAEAVLLLSQGDSTLALTSLDPDVWRRIERAARNLCADHAAAISPPPKRAMIQ